MPVVTQQFRSKSLPNRGILAGRGEEDSLGQQVSEHRQVVVPFAPVHLVGTHPDHVIEAQPRMRRFHVGEKHPPHSRVALPEDLASTLDRHLAHEGQSEGFELLGEVLAASLPRRSHTIHLTVIAPAPPWQSAHDHALLVEDIQMPPLHRLDVVVADHRGSCPSTFLRPQLGRFLNLQEKCGGLRLKPRLHYLPALPKPKQLSKGLFRCHRSPSSATRQAPPSYWK